jgi:hypothetical protein
LLRGSVQEGHTHQGMPLPTHLEMGSHQAKHMGLPKFAIR